MRKLKFCHVLIAPFLRKLACVMLMHTWLTFSSEIVSEIIKRFRYYALHGVLRQTLLFHSKAVSPCINVIKLKYNLEGKLCAYSAVRKDSCHIWAAKHFLERRAVPFACSDVATSSITLSRPGPLRNILRRHMTYLNDMHISLSQCATVIFRLVLANFSLRSCANPAS